MLRARPAFATCLEKIVATRVVQHGSCKVVMSAVAVRERERFSRATFTASADGRRAAWLLEFESAGKCPVMAYPKELTSRVAERLSTGASDVSRYVEARAAERESQGRRAAAAQLETHGVVRTAAPVETDNRVVLSGPGCVWARGSSPTASLLTGEHAKAAEHITWVGAGCNLALSTVQGMAGLFCGSAALVADAAHSVSDLLSDGVTLGTLHYCKRPTDETHPYGYGRYEALGTLGVGALVGVAGLQIGYSALDTFWIILNTPEAHAPLTHVPLALGAAIASFVVKEWLFRATVSVGERVDSQVLIANAWHHRSDALSSLFALIGVGGAAAGYPLLDPLGGVAVACMVGRIGWNLGTGAVQDLADKANPEVLEAVRAAAASVPAVLDLPAVRARRCGPYTMVELDARVFAKTDCADTNRAAAHAAAAELRTRVAETVPKVSEVVVHVVPTPAQLSAGSTDAAEIEQAIRRITTASPGVLGVSSVQQHVVPVSTLGGPAGLLVEVAIAVAPDATVAEARATCREVEQCLQRAHVGPARGTAGVRVVGATVRLDL
jgi:cation diffusion facilitator family transporter